MDLRRNLVKRLLRWGVLALDVDVAETELVDGRLHMVSAAGGGSMRSERRTET